MKKEIKEIFSAEMLSIAGGLFAGSLLAAYTQRLELVPGLLILLPGFLEMRGNISGSLSARLGSALHLGTLKPHFKNTKTLRENIIAAVILAAGISLLLGLVAYATTFVFFRIPFQEIIWIAFLAGIISNLIQMPLTIFASFKLYSRGNDPDNIMGPYITTLGDIISVVSLIIVTLVIT
jgi:mgtE-like transporter